MKKSVLITGASYGMGEAIAKRIAHRFDCVALHGRDESRLKAVADHIEKENGCDVTIHMSDFSDLSDVEKMIAEITEKYASLEAIVINAGMYREGELVDFDMKTIKADFNVNFFSAWELVKGLLGLVKSGTTKRIIIIGSTAAYEAYPDVPAYGVQKWALRGFAHNLRKGLMEDKIGVSFVSPGGTWTGMWEGEPLDDDRLLEPNDIAVMIDASFDLSKQAVMEEIKIVPILGDLHG